MRKLWVNDHDALYEKLGFYEKLWFGMRNLFLRDGEGFTELGSPLLSTL